MKDIKHNNKLSNNNYPNQKLMRKNKRIKRELEMGLCESCKDKGVDVHHIDYSKDNHAIENLKLLCEKCHSKAHIGRTVKTSIWIRRYGMTSKRLAESLRCSIHTIEVWHKRGELNYFLGN